VTPPVAESAALTPADDFAPKRIGTVFTPRNSAIMIENQPVGPPALPERIAQSASRARSLARSST
jgi:hypothetical protein